MKQGAVVKYSIACLLSILFSSNLYAEETASQRLAKVSPIKVQVQGASHDLSENLLLYLPSMRGMNCRSSQDRLNRFIDASQPQLTKAAESMGYYDARFKMSSARQANCWMFNIKVQSGGQVKVIGQSIAIQGEGAKLENFKKIKDKPPYLIGDPLIHQPYEDFKSSLGSQSNKLGFFDAKYNARRLEVDPDKLEANVVVDYNTGKRYRISSVDIQQDVLKGKYLQRYMNVRAGDYYDSDELLKQQRALEASGYYKDVQLRTKRSEATNQQVPVEIITEKRKRYTYTGKLGYGTDTGARVEAKMDAHWVNPKGHKLSAEVSHSDPESKAGFQYKVPLWEPEHEYAALSAGWERSKSDDIRSQALKSEFSYNRRNDDQWQQTAYIKYLKERTETDTDKDDSQLTLLGARLKKTYSDDLLFPTEGWQLTAQLQGSHEKVLSDQSLAQGEIQAKYLKRIDRGGKVVVRGKLGTTWTDELADTPKSLRYFAGGQNSVRGYDFESLGTTDDSGDVIGGKHVVTTSLEYEHPIDAKWGVAGFVDAGNAFEDWNDYSMKVGAGLGVRYKSPVGPIRVDVATPTDETDLHVYFGLGPEF